ncbi:hypothetical protein LTR84_001956 [Exophiala bonariae]|uniref:Clr5 domain-containing protein n=1 Tax=Exophiala bonariae TaxID=1690606 RepID=A0AAV9NE97_9EURO|nr:hypothetical protein LTR84_001956 [Exophiala bonariae]
MASEDESQSADHHHDEQDWEAQKENFRQCYIDNNMTRKAAAKFMKDFFGFDATPRQWERRIKQWGFQKYSTREERMSQIAQSGKSVLDVSKPGRRPRAHSSNSLHPREDRNLRRFARREVSRSRSRTRSNSFTNSSRPVLGDEFQELGQPAFDNQAFNVNFSSTPSLPSQNTTGFNANATANAINPHHPPHFNFHSEKAVSSFDGTAGHDGVFTVGNRQWTESQGPNSTRQWNLPGSQVSMSTYPPSLPTQTSIGQGLSNLNGTYLNENESPPGFPIDNAFPLPNTHYDYGLSEDGIGINPNIISSNPLSEQQLYNQTIPNAQASTGADTNFDVIDFQLFVNDVDSASAQLALNEDDFHPVPPVQGPFPASAPAVNIAFTGPLQNDVGPLVEELVRNMHGIALLGNESGLQHKLSTEAQIFTDRLAIVLDNFTNTQQRAVQDMSRILRHLRDKNKLLEESLNTLQMQSTMSTELQHHHATIPSQPDNYMFHQSVGAGEDSIYTKPHFP